MWTEVPSIWHEQHSSDVNGSILTPETGSARCEQGAVALMYTGLRSDLNNTDPICEQEFNLMWTGAFSHLRQEVTVMKAYNYTDDLGKGKEKEVTTVN